jgi:hypothetical protein
MTDVRNLLDEVRRLLRTRNVSYTSASAAHDVYEAFVLSLIVGVAQRSGASVEFRTARGQPTTSLLFRTSPGLLHVTSPAYSHAVIEFLNVPPLEVHLGVRVQGKSGVLHECDVLVLPSDEADRSRAAAVAPRSSNCLLATECKFYAANLSLDVARSFVGLQADLGTKYTHFVANIPSRRVARYLSGRGRTWEQNVTPGAPQVRDLEALVREAFKTHCARSEVVLP